MEETSLKTKQHSASAPRPQPPAFHLALPIAAAILATAATALAQTPNPVPTLTHVGSPATVTPGSNSFSLSVNGVGIAQNAIVKWNGVALFAPNCGGPVAPTSEQYCVANVDKSLVETAGTAMITIVNPPPGGGTSNALLLPITNLNPTLGIAATESKLPGMGMEVVVGDFDGDGVIDTAMLYNDCVTDPTCTSTVQIRMANTTKTVRLTNENSAGRMIATDLDGNGTLDLAISTTHSVISLLNDGSGNLSVKGLVGFADQFALPDAIAAADFNKDGKIDIVVALDADNPSLVLLLGNGDGTFTNTGAFGDVGYFSQQSGFAVGDFNDDGNPDFAYANGFGLTVWTGDGAGHFTKAYANNSMDTLLAVTTGDFNGDGKLDLAVITSNDTELGIFLGDGYGGFRLAWRMKVDPNPGGSNLVVGDLNGDGKPDLVMATNLPSLVPFMVFLGKGDGSFQPASLNLPRGGFRSVAVADLNGDGLLDVVGVSLIYAKVTVGLQVVPATSVLPMAVTFGSVGLKTGSPPQIVTLTNSGGLPIVLSGITLGGANPGDFFIMTNTCGTLPVTLKPSDNCTVSITFAPAWTGSRNATLTFADNSLNSVKTVILSGTGTSIPLAFISQPLSPTTLTAGSGNPEILYVSGAGFVPDSSVWLNGKALTTTYFNGSLLFAVIPPSYLATPSTAIVTVANPWPSGISNAVPLTISAPTSNTPMNRKDVGVGGNPSAIVAGDFNRDGILDMAVVNTNDNTVSVLIGDGRGGFTVSKVIALNGNGADAIGVADFNGDGNPDLVVANANSSNLTLLIGDGNGGFTPTPSAFSTCTTPTSLAVGDYNRDGRADVAVVCTAHATVSSLQILLGDGNGGFVSYGSPAGPGAVPESVVTADFNGDGFLDLAVANTLSDNVSIYLGDGAGNFSLLAAAPLTGLYPSSLVVGDFNGDGKPDLAVANGGIVGSNASKTVTILLGDGKGGFTAGANVSTGANPFQIVAGDFNGDGYLDLATANYGDNTVSILLGDGSGHFRQSSAPATDSKPAAVALGDFNGDGRLDLVVVNSGGNDVSVLLQQPGTAAAPAPPDSLWSAGHSNLTTNQMLQSRNGYFQAIMQADGNFVIYQLGKPIWASQTAGQGFTPYNLVMQQDGNLVVYGYLNRCAPNQACVPAWASNTNGKGTAPYILVMQNDGNLVVYDSNLTATWASGTNR